MDQSQQTKLDQTMKKSTNKAGSNNEKEKANNATM